MSHAPDAFQRNCLLGLEGKQEGWYLRVLEWGGCFAGLSRDSLRAIGTSFPLCTGFQKVDPEEAEGSCWREGQVDR